MRKESKQHPKRAEEFCDGKSWKRILFIPHIFVEWNKEK